MKSISSDIIGSGAALDKITAELLDNVPVVELAVAKKAQEVQRNKKNKNKIETYIVKRPALTS